MPSDEQLSALQERLGYTFRSPALLLEALTHASYLPEHPDAPAHNQRLEFLGDSVLHFILTDELYREFPVDREGVLSRHRATLSKGAFLTQLARDLGIDAGLRLATSEDGAGGRQRASILEDACEAIVGAIYLDSDLPTVQRIVLTWYGSLKGRLATLAAADNPKGRLQELVQPIHGNDALRYEVKEATGPKHAREYAVVVFLKADALGEGRGSSKKVAEEAAARAALLALPAELIKPAT